MKQNVSLRQLTFLAICIALSLVTKRVISPVTNLLTDLIRIPGGGVPTALSLMFLLVGTCSLKWRWATTAASLAQSLLALSMGMGANQGIFALLTYSLPGLVIDLFRMVWPNRSKLFFVLACASANAVSALLSNLLVFQMKGIPFLLWMLVAGTAGLFAGLLGAQLFRRVIRIPESRAAQSDWIS